MSGLTGAAFGGGPSLIASANGNVFAQNGIVPYAKGGIVDRPMVFPFAKGIGLMGEAGPEAIMPLKRGADGKLGVAGGGGGTTVNVSVDASGSSVQGDGPNANQLGRVLGAAVQAEIVKQQRPGGLLATTR
jgi:lambda family phage tail tape measure protein